MGQTGFQVGVRWSLSSVMKWGQQDVLKHLRNHLPNPTLDSQPETIYETIYEASTKTYETAGQTIYEPSTKGLEQVLARPSTKAAPP